MKAKNEALCRALERSKLKIVSLGNSVAEGRKGEKSLAEILRAISRSRTDAQPVFDAIARAALRLIGDVGAAVTRLDGDTLHLAALTSTSKARDEQLKAQFPCPVSKFPGHARAIRFRVPYCVSDREKTKKAISDTARARAWRSAIFVPLLRGKTAIGTISVSRRHPGAFSDHDIELLKTFAAQAVIAIENARLFNETKGALERQTATAEILDVISRSQTDVQPVFDTIATSALRLCEGNFTLVTRFDGALIHIAALSNLMPEAEEVIRGAWPAAPSRANTTARCIAERQVVQIPDIYQDPDYQFRNAHVVNFRSVLAVPLMREGEPLGAISVGRVQAGEFPDHQVALLKTFADQAVIAIENVRLFNETKEALEQQTATAEILRVISGSPTDMQPVFNAILDKAMRLCDSHLGTAGIFDGEKHQFVAVRAGDPEVEKWVLERGPFRPHPGGPLSKALEGKIVQTADLKESAGYRNRRPLQTLLVEKIGVRSQLGVPLMKEDRAIGVIGIYRPEVRPFTQKEIDLVRTFADQAVIAIENVRLFKELQARNAEVSEALEQQTATAEVLRVISRSTFDLETVLQTLMDNAAMLCRAHRGVMFRRDGDVYRVATMYNATPELREYLQSHPVEPNRATITGRSIIEKRPVHVQDVLADSAYQWTDAARLGSYRSVLSVPLLREGEPMGTIALTRDVAEPFSGQEIALVTTFADQATIAIENVRLFKEIQDKNRQLEVANRHKSEFLANMSHELRTPLNAVIGFSEVLQQGMVGGLNDKQSEYVDYIHTSGSHLLSLINDILDLSKVEAGRMELDVTHFSVPLAIDNALTLVKERASRHGVTLDCTLDSAVSEIDADERKFKQVMLNLLSNAVKFTPEGGKITVAARTVDGMVEVSVTDTGIGIAPEDCEAVFEEFRQVGAHAEHKAQGTGLGLALTKKFIDLHGGRIWLTSTPGKGSTFSFTLPIKQPVVLAAA